MSRNQRPASLVLFVLALAAAFALALPGRAAASDPYTFTIILEGTIGGPLQEGGGADSGVDNSGFQFGFTVANRANVLVGGRVGSIDFDNGLGGLGDATLDYVNIGGEYRFHEGFYDSGVYFGLGNYEVEGRDASGNVVSENSVGLAIGLTGEFELAKRLGLLFEVTSHVTDLATAEIFVTGHVGLAIHF